MRVDNEVVYGVFTISWLLKIIGLFCKRALYKRLYFEKETCNFKEPTVDHEEVVVLKKKRVDQDVWEGCVRMCACVLQHCHRRLEKELRIRVDNVR